MTWTILLVEDDIEDALILTNMMREAPFHSWKMTHVSRLDHALIELGQSNYNIVILDLSLPDSVQSGTLQTIEFAAPQAAIIVMTGLDDDQVADEMIAIGAQDYLIKGQTNSHLVMRSMRYAIERKRLQFELSATAAELERANQQLQAMVIIDPLTKVHNRPSFESHYALTWSRARDTELSLTLLLIDLDGFRSYNEKFGFLLGDLCLQRIAATLRHHLRPSDFLARYQGGEFAVLLPDTSNDVAHAIAESLRKAVEQLQIVHTSTSTQLLTVSIGLASLIPQANRDPHELLAHADHALFLAKAAGGNQVAEDTPPNQA